MRSQPGLIVAHPNLPATLRVTSAALTAGSSRIGYVRGTVASPVCLSIVAFAGCLGLGYAGAIGAVLAVACVIALGIHAARYRSVRAYIDEQMRAKERAHRESQRVKRLRSTAGSRQQHYHELRLLVEEIERLDPAEAARFELQDLLDHFIDLAVRHQRCVDALRLAGASALPAAIPVVDATRSPRRRDILQRRLHHRDECLRAMEQLADELEGVDELIHLVVQRAASASVGAESDREIDRRLWELDEVDAALRQLSA
jgi:hypothetical protein